MFVGAKPIVPANRLGSITVSATAGHRPPIIHPSLEWKRDTAPFSWVKVDQSSNHY